ncbi:MAG: tetratricopeptide repeat protein, partial [Krumholzibacteria bacterium]|nr:tetratricopeptide repeat protein [Candidatus Krumholzibacteria bacterium]
FHRARRAAAAGDGDALRANLDAALAAAPGRADYRLWHSLDKVRGFDTTTLVKVLPGSVLDLLASPIARARYVVAGHQAALLAVGCFWTVLLAAMTAAWWRHLAHDLSARVFRDRRHRLRTWLPLLVPLVLLACKPGWFGFLAAMSLPLLVLTRGRERVLLGATWALAALLVFPSWPVLRLAVPALDPDSEVTLLDRAGQLPPDAATIATLRERLDGTTDPARQDRLTVVLAVQEARRGRYTASNELFAQVLKRDPQNFPALVGTANNIYFLGRLEEAVARYEAAARTNPTRGEIPYNLAQVYFKKLFVPEATAALDRSRALGYVAPAGVQDERSGSYAAVVYPGLTNRALAEACRAEAALYPPLVTVASWRKVLGVPPAPLLALVGVPFLAALLVIGTSRRQQDPRECENCGVPLCHGCCKVRDSAWLCPACGETADRARSSMILATLLKNRSRDEGMARGARVIRLGRLVPGAGHLVTGRVGAAWFRVALVAAGWSLLCAGWSFDPAADWSTPGLLLDAETVDPRWLPLPAAQWEGWTGLPTLGGIALIALAWLIAMLDGPGLRRGLHDRHSLAPLAGRGDAAADAR